ncbi:hypothetical protein AVEN_103837-1, partial [Araneus ventricosus]
KDISRKEEAKERLHKPQMILTAIFRKLGFLLKGLSLVQELRPSRESYKKAQMEDEFQAKGVLAGLTTSLKSHADHEACVASNREEGNK